MTKAIGLTKMSPVFPTNCNTMPGSEAYQALMHHDFQDWQLSVEGLVAQPMKLSLDKLRAMPARTQLKRHDCVEGWSAIGQWTGVQHRLLLKQAQLLPAARYIVFRCADDFDGTPYDESVDVADAIHPQTILAWAMNGKPLARISHTAECIGALNLRKLFCENALTEAEDLPDADSV